MWKATAPRSASPRARIAPRASRLIPALPAWLPPIRAVASCNHKPSPPLNISAPAPSTCAGLPTSWCSVRASKLRSMTSSDRYPLLEGIRCPADLRKLPANKLKQVAQELRKFLIQTCATRGGHFAAGLGTVELSVALHYVFDTPLDRIVWDVGHQAYPHKVLTGRREQLHTIKQKDGLAPFPTRAESVFDTFGVGHSSTSISAALGMAIASAQAGERRRVVAVIG